MSGELVCQLVVASEEPMTLAVALAIPASATSSVRVPRVLLPLGAFVRVQIVDAHGATVYETNQPKFTPKLSPDSPEAYVAVAPGSAHGERFVLDGAVLPAGDYEIRATYSNLYFQGPKGNPIGEQRCTATLPYHKH